MTDDELNEWGLAYVEELDTIYKDDEIYQSGDIGYVMQLIDGRDEGLTEQQAEWLEDFYSEV